MTSYLCELTQALFRCHSRLLRLLVMRAGLGYAEFDSEQ